MFDSNFKPKPNSTAICIEIPEELSPERRRALAQRIARAAAQEGSQGARVLWSEVYDDRLGPPVFYQP